METKEHGFWNEQIVYIGKTNRCPWALLVQIIDTGRYTVYEERFNNVTEMFSATSKRLFVLK
jgi:hypothetical protein